ncbi:MAG: hypothetical protein M3N31_02530 [Actinomycetota bacterium]|nr:hypothetical protein [Actinomycetota bacterium]
MLNPEKLFASPSYLMALALGQDEERAGRWRGLLLEDCDELVRAGPNSAAARRGIPQQRTPPGVLPQPPQRPFPPAEGAGGQLGMSPSNA